MEFFHNNAQEQNLCAWNEEVRFRPLLYKIQQGISDSTVPTNCLKTSDKLDRAQCKELKICFCFPFSSHPFHELSRKFPEPGLRQVPELQVRVQVRVFVIYVSMSPRTWLLHESEYECEYWLMSKSMSTGLWSTFYVSSSIAFFSLWKGNPQILTNPGQSSNYPLSM